MPFWFDFGASQLLILFRNRFSEVSCHLDQSSTQGMRWAPSMNQDPASISWEDKHGLRDLYRNLAELRERVAPIHSGDFIPLPLQGVPSAFSFIRKVDEQGWALSFRLRPSPFLLSYSFATRHKSAVWGQLPISGLQNSGPPGQRTFAFDSNTPKSSGSA